MKYKYWDLVKVSGKTSTLTPTPKVDEKKNNQEADKLITDFITESRKKSDEVSTDLRSIREFLEELKTKNCEPPVGFEDNALNNDEIADVLEMIWEFHDKYFSETPLTEELSRIFMYNIPKNIYNAARTIRDHMEPDCLNPLYWFYLMNLADPEYMMAHFITVAISSISDKDYDRVDELNLMYCEDQGLVEAPVDCADVPETIITEDVADEYEPVDPNTIDPIVNDEIIKTDDESTSIDDFDPDVDVTDESSNLNDNEENDYETGNSTENE